MNPLCSKDVNSNLIFLTLFQKRDLYFALETASAVVSGTWASASAAVAAAATVVTAAGAALMAPWGFATELNLQKMLA